MLVFVFLMFMFLFVFLATSVSGFFPFTEINEKRP